MLPVELWFVFGSRINFPMSVELQSSAFMESFVQMYFFYSSILHAIISHAEIGGGGGGGGGRVRTSNESSLGNRPRKPSSLNSKIIMDTIWSS